MIFFVKLNPGDLPPAALRRNRDKHAQQWETDPRQAEMLFKNRAK